MTGLASTNENPAAMAGFPCVLLSLCSLAPAKSQSGQAEAEKREGRGFRDQDAADLAPWKSIGRSAMNVQVGPLVL